ncbi:MAG: L-histidine N(alpha)-methyltransferase [Pyrinomonadaceae bacterium]
MNETATSTRNQLVIRQLSRIDFRNQLTADIRAGLSASPKWLLPKYLYDDLGSQLFEAICLLPEYYLTRSENEILSRHADEIAGTLNGPVTLLELGSGNAAKTRNLIQALLRRQAELHYVPVDISASALESSSRELMQSYPGLSITAYAGDYFTGLKALEGEPSSAGRTLALFLGSNIGNFDPGEALEFLRAVRRVLRPGDGLLLGADLRKERSRLELAYDDPLGVTSSFNLNVLLRLNREFDADFDLRGFRHLAHYNEVAGRIEIYIESLRQQTVHLRGLEMSVDFAAGEHVHTENSHKYDLPGLASMATATGFSLDRTWFDEAGLFSSNLFLAV